MSNYYLEFNGNGSLYTADSAAFGYGTNNFSMSCWIKTSTAVGTLFMNDVGWPETWALYVDAGKAVFFGELIHGAGDFTLTSATSVNDGEWHHIAAIIDRSGDGIIYIDNTAEGTTDISSKVGQFAQAALGIGVNGAGVKGPYTGDLDDIRIYTGIALTPSQVSSIYNEGRGTKVNENNFGSITSNGWYSNVDNNPDTTLDGRKIVSGLWTDHNTTFGTGIDGVKIVWFEGGFPILPTNISTANLAGMKIGVASQTLVGDFDFTSPVILMTSYVDNSIVQPQPSYSPNFNVGGVPLSVSLCYDPELYLTTGDTVGFFHALDVLETYEDAEIESDDETIVSATSATFSGNRLQVSRISNNYYLNTVRLGETSAPINPIVLQGLSMATGNNDELILRRDADLFNINDIGINLETGELDIKSVNIGGTPLSAGRIGNKYYLIVKPFPNP